MGVMLLSAYTSGRDISVKLALVQSIPTEDRKKLEPLIDAAFTKGDEVWSKVAPKVLGVSAAQAARDILERAHIEAPVPSPGRP